jgi:hypothetical protein
MYKSKFSSFNIFALTFLKTKSTKRIGHNKIPMLISGFITIVIDDTDDFAKYSTRDKFVLPLQYAQADAETLNSTNTTIHAPVA